MRDSICKFLLSACVLTAGALVNACSDTSTAPPVVVEDPRGVQGTTPPTPPAFSPSSAANALGVPGVGIGSASATAVASASVTASTTALQVGARGMVCNVGPGLHIRVPRPLGTQLMVQSFETAWWYPRVVRWDGRQWVHYADIGWVSARLPAASPQWTVYQSRTALQDDLVANVPDGYYAVQSWMYFDGSRQWTSEWEGAYEYRSPISTVATSSYWCHITSPPRAAS